MEYQSPSEQNRTLASVLMANASKRPGRLISKTISLNIFIILKGTLSWPGTLYFGQKRFKLNNINGGGRRDLQCITWDLTANDTQPLPKSRSSNCEGTPRTPKLENILPSTWPAISEKVMDRLEQSFQVDGGQRGRAMKHTK